MLDALMQEDIVPQKLNNQEIEDCWSFGSENRRKGKTFGVTNL